MAESPRNKMATTANQFNAAWAAWANAVNAMKPGSLDMDEATAWEPIPDLLRKVERCRTAWLRGDR